MAFIHGDGLRVVGVVVICDACGSYNHGLSIVSFSDDEDRGEHLFGYEPSYDSRVQVAGYDVETKSPQQAQEETRHDQELLYRHRGLAPLKPACSRRRFSDRFWQETADRRYGNEKCWPKAK